MAFSESLKLNVKQKSHFRCCICHNLFVEVHHIIPQADGSDDSIENAAPLCASCHSNHGGNPDFRKTIKQMRDFWYDRCSKIETQPDVLEISTKIDNMYSLISTVNQNQHEQAKHIKNLAINVSDFFSNYVNHIRNATSFQEISDATSILTSGATGDIAPSNTYLPSINLDKFSLSRKFEIIRRQIITTLIFNDLGDKLLELKDFLDNNFELLDNYIDIKRFYDKWIIDKGLETLKGQRPAGLWNQDEVNQLKSDLDDISII